MKNVKTVVLAGGGHTHALALKQIQQNPIPNTRLVLLSTTRHTPYSGMLPGVISGYYSPEQAYIDLEKLAYTSNCEFIRGSVTALDPESQVITTDSGELISYDLLSINTGSTQSSIVDARHCLSIKPVHQFLSWLYHELPQRLESHKKTFELVVVGAGAAGVETAMALKHRYCGQPVNIHLVSGSTVLPGYPVSAQKMVLRELKDKNITCNFNFKVASVENQQLFSTDGGVLAYDQLVLATSASPASWPAQSTITTDNKGFILVNDQLQSVSHPNIFAVGDIASFTSVSLAKCGVYAVRQAPTLLTNLRNTLTGHPLKPYVPQQQFLALLSCADGRAIASRGWFRARGKMVWYWKDSIDQKFMSQFPSPDSGFTTYP